MVQAGRAKAGRAEAGKAKVSKVTCSIYVVYKHTPGICEVSRERPSGTFSVDRQAYCSTPRKGWECYDSVP